MCTLCDYKLPTPLYLSNDKCVEASKCPSHYFEFGKTTTIDSINYNDGKCLQCSSDCSECSGTLDHCTSCSAELGKFLHNNECVTSCPISYYAITDKRECG